MDCFWRLGLGSGTGISWNYECRRSRIWFKYPAEPPTFRFHFLINISKRRINLVSCLTVNSKWSLQPRQVHECHMDEHASTVPAWSVVAFTRLAKPLAKECQPATAIRKRNGKKSQTSRTALLEEKLDGLVSLLPSQATINGTQLGVQKALSVLSPPYYPTLTSNVALPSSLIWGELSRYTISDAVAEESVDRFQHTFIPFFPFVHIPEIMSIFELRPQKPFLWLVIMFLTTRSVVLQLAMASRILQIVSKRIVAEHEKSLDLLIHYYKKNGSYLLMWVQIAVALAVDLGIHEPGPQDLEPDSLKSWASLGRWNHFTGLHTWMIVSAFKKREITNQADEIWPSTAYFVKAMQMRLQNLRQNLPANMQSNRLALFSLYMTEILSKEAILQRPILQEARFRRLEELNSLLTTIERWYEVFHQIPLVECIGIPFGIFDQVDTEEVRKRINILDILEGFAQGFEDLPKTAGLVDGVGESGVFFRAPPVLRAMKDKFAARLNPTTVRTVDGPFNFDVSEDFAMYFTDEQWLPEMFGSLWDLEIPQ
ncbi:hypothetical protein BDZ45DRAFT_810765 [Acephala macrosclerotiorum]|nr:hypothetical protein BDZ45DRAFT_810765 [Acephala macrosclerotiorum]